MNNLLRPGTRFALLVTLLTVFSNALFAVDTLKDGQWSDSLIWSVNAVPGEGATVNIHHTIVLSGTLKTGTLVVEPGGELLFSNREGNVDLTCNDIIIRGNGRVIIPADLSGCTIHCDAIRLKKVLSEKGLFQSTCSGLNLSCKGIYNEGEIEWKTGNYQYINGNIVNNGLITYTGNGLLMYGDSLVQEDSQALMNVAGFYHQLNWSNPDQGFKSFNPKPLNVQGTVRFKNTGFYAMGGPIIKGGPVASIAMNGGYFSGVNCRDLIIRGSGHCSIGSSVLENCTLEDTLYSSNFTVTGKTTVNGRIRPQVMETPYYGSSSLKSLGELTINGCLEDSTDKYLTLSYEGTLINNGTINLKAGGILGYYSPAMVNNGPLYSSLHLIQDSLPVLDLPYTHVKSNYLVNNNLIEGNLVVDTAYTVTSKFPASWSGEIRGSGNLTGGKSKLIGTHHFAASTVSDFILGAGSTITASRTAFTNISGSNTDILAKSGCSFENTSGCSIVATGRVDMIKSNSGSLVANDSLICNMLKYNGDLITKGFARSENDWFVEIHGSWQNYGNFINNSGSSMTMYGKLLNLGSVKNVNLSMRGPDALLLSGGDTLKNLNITLENNERGTLWYLTPLSMSGYFSYSLVTKNFYTVKFSKNDVEMLQNYTSNLAVGDTGSYFMYEKSPGTIKANFNLTLNNPFNFISPVPATTFKTGDVEMKWPAIPFATAYKLCVVKMNGQQELPFINDSILTDTTAFLSNLAGNKYKAYLSARFGSVWSPSTTGLVMDFSKITSVRNPLANEALKINKSDGGLLVELNSHETATAPLSVFDMSGKCLIHRSVQLSSGTSRLEVPVNLQKGVYILEIKLSNKTLRSKLMY